MCYLPDPVTADQLLDLLPLHACGPPVLPATAQHHCPPCRRGPPPHSQYMHLKTVPSHVLLKTSAQNKTVAGYHNQGVWICVAQFTVDNLHAYVYLAKAIIDELQIMNVL